MILNFKKRKKVISKLKKSVNYLKAQVRVFYNLTGLAGTPQVPKPVICSRHPASGVISFPATL